MSLSVDDLTKPVKMFCGLHGPVEPVLKGMDVPVCPFCGTTLAEIRPEPKDMVIGVPVLLAVESVTPQPDSKDEWVVTFKTVLPKDQVASIIAVSRKHLVVGELQLTEGEL